MWKMIIVVVLILAGLSVLGYLGYMQIVMVLATIFITFLAIGGILLLTWWYLPLIPFAIELLSNDPNMNRRDKNDYSRNYGPSNFGFFTGIQPGQVKIIERNQRFIRCIMRFDGHTFAGYTAGANIPRNSERFWEVVKTPAGESDFFPIVKPWEHDVDERGNHVTRLPKWWEPTLYKWCRRVYSLTGFVFTGIYPFQTVRVYPMDRYEISYDDEGNVTTRNKQDYSDHYRVEDFQFGVVVSKADTLDKVPVTITQNFIGQVANPYEAAYATDDAWGARLLSIITDALTQKTRTLPLEEVLSSTQVRGRDKLKKAVLDIEVKPNTKKGETEEDVTKGIRAFGFRAVDTYFLDISPSDPSFAKGLADLAQAKVDRDAAIERAKGMAAQVDEPAAAAARHGVYGQQSLKNRGMADAAKAAGDKAIVILGESPQIDPLTTKIERNTRRDN